MTDPWTATIQSYFTRGVLVDSNLLLLWFVGAFDRKLIQTFKHTRQYVVEDFETLNLFLGKFRVLVALPNTFTEVSNLASHLGGRASEFYQGVFSEMIRSLDEQCVPSTSLAGTQGLAKLGLTDSAITALAKGKYLLLTDDFKLSQYFTAIGGDALNFTHIRTLNW